MRNTARTGAPVSGRKARRRFAFIRSAIAFFATLCEAERANRRLLQLFPSTVLSLRVQSGSDAPLSVLLPALLASLFSLALGILLVRLFCRK